jgi:protein-S-isoprenylcysteine O-methyltransferase Ste14
MVQFFPTELANLLYNIVVVLWVLSEIVGGRIVPALRRRGTKIERRDRGSALLIIGGVFLSIAIAFLFASNGIAMLPGWVSYVGIALMVAGIIVRQWAIAVLGRYFSPVVGIQEGQKVVKTGPYRLVRHPSYTGALLIIVGVGLALQSWGAVLVLLLVFGITFGYRIRMEEKVLVSELGDEYVQYMKTTKRIIPYII